MMTPPLTHDIRQVLETRLKACRMKDIVEATSISFTSLSKFRHGHRQLGPDALDRLAAYLGLRLVKRRSR